MGTASHYWTWITIDAAGTRKVQVVSNAKNFFQEQFLGLDAAEVPDRTIQRQLFRMMQDNTSRSNAEMCLRCFISHQIDQCCLSLAQRFGEKHCFKHTDLLPFVLEVRSVSGLTQSARPSLMNQILQRFDPEKANLSTWTNQMVRSEPELNRFLLQECGLYLASDWAILNDTPIDRAARILAEFHSFSPSAVQSACQLLESYWAVYCRDRRQNRSKAGKRCSKPDAEQLQEIAQRLPHPAPSPEEILDQLQTLAEQLRQYRVHVRGGALPTESIDAPDRSAEIAQLPSLEPDEDNEQQFFLSRYRQEFQECLNQALTHITDRRILQHQRKKPATDRAFLTALTLFHCQNQKMSDIAPVVGLQKQFQVARLLKLKEFRADVKREMIVMLFDRVQKLAQDYTTPDRLEQLNQQLEVLLEALEEQVTNLVEAAASEASVGRRSMQSLFAKRLCAHLDTRRS